MIATIYIAGLVILAGLLLAFNIYEAVTNRHIPINTDAIGFGLIIWPLIPLVLIFELIAKVLKRIRR